MSEVDFTGGSQDFVDEATDILDRADYPYILLVFCRKGDIRAVSRLTPLSEEWVDQMNLDGSLAGIIDAQINGDDDDDDDDDQYEPAKA